MFEILIVLKKFILWPITTSFTTHLRYFLAEIYLCELNILFTFHYMIFKSELELYIKWT